MHAQRRAELAVEVVEADGTLRIDTFLLQQVQGALAEQPETDVEEEVVSGCLLSLLLLRGFLEHEVEVQRMALGQGVDAVVAQALGRCRDAVADDICLWYGRQRLGS